MQDTKRTGKKEIGRGRGLHTAKLVIQPRLAFVVYYTLIKEYAVQNTEVIFEMSKVINLYPFKFLFEVIKAFFKGGIQHGLFEAVFDEIYSMPGKAYDKDNSRRYSGNQEEGKRYGGKAVYNIVQNIPDGHIFNIKPHWRISQEGCLKIQANPYEKK
jgi:hypothetical protein